MHSRIRHFLYNVRYSFPVQLLIAHLKHNQLLLFFWIILFAFITRSFGGHMGIPYLFLAPEYLGQEGFPAWYVIGICCGAFIVAFHIASYIVNSFRFPFLASLSKPFLKYTWNNSIIPLLFILIYSYNIIIFQYKNEFSSVSFILGNLLGLYLGMITIFSLSVFYFITVSKDAFKIFGIEVLEQRKQKSKKRQIKKTKKHNQPRNKQIYYVKNYFSHFYKISIARDTSHYDEDIIQAVFVQNHSVAAFFEIGVVVLIFLMGYFRDIPAMFIPAGGSIFLSITMLLMMASAFHNWLKGWTITLFAVVVLVINMISPHASFGKRSRAFGMDYNKPPVNLSGNIQQLLPTDSLCRTDSLEGIRRLENWKKNIISTAEEKPLIIFLNVSGGGLKSAMWTTNVLQETQKVTGGRLFKHVHLITGSSGGMIGAAYFRELYLRENQNKEEIDCTNPKYLNNISGDILNPVSFSLAVSDIFFRTQQKKVGNHYYIRDRGYEFEKALHENTGFIMDKKLIAYQQPETDAIIPAMVFTPAVINDGRRMLISALPLSFFGKKSRIHQNTLPEDIEFMRFFQNQDAKELRFSTAIRMSATFPYILPAVDLPTNPSIELMDAGFRDNSGFKTSLRYIYYFRKWLEENTSGVLILQIRENHRSFDLKTKGNNTLIESMISPLGNVYENMFRIQDFTNEQMMGYAKSWYKGHIFIQEFDLNPLPKSDEDIISMSFHLTSLEKKKIKEAIQIPVNRRVLHNLAILLYKKEND